ncbi:MAG TPA: type II secretion system F family protein [Longimicrobiales bacterium]|nr:type II secretion system F family protein [Longimicrobiales bacterium]
MGMTILLLASLVLTIGLVLIVAMEVVPAKERAVRHRLDDIEAIGSDPHALAEKRRRLVQGQRVLEILEVLGHKLQPGRDGAASDTDMLRQAGYRKSSAPAIYWGLRLALPLTLGLLSLSVLPLAGTTGRLVFAATLYFAGIGYITPLLVVRSKRRRRHKDLRHALADTLDLLVVCVEAGLGLNQALVRVAEEIRHVSEAMSLELLQTNAEIRAGTPRDTALRQLADRTGVDDLSSLVTMLIQTDRFGTSIARSLRVQSDTLREKRKQRAEEAAAKTAIKMVFPLVFCIFPAMFVVILGPAAIRLIRALSALS